MENNLYDISDFKSRLKALRKYRGYLKQAGVCNRLNISRQVWSLWENGNRFPSLAQLQELANFFYVDISYFFIEGAKPKDFDITGGIEMIFNSIKNPFKNIFMDKQIKQRTDNLLQQFNESMNRISLIEWTNPFEAVKAYLDLYHVGLSLEPVQYLSLITRLSRCLQAVDKSGMALYYMLLTGYSGFNLEPLAIDSCDKYIDYLFSKCHENLLKHMGKIKALAVINDYEQSIKLIEHISRCKQSAKIINALEWQNLYSDTGLVLEYNIVFIDAAIFEKTNDLDNEYKKINEKYPNQKLFFIVRPDYFSLLVKDYPGIVILNLEKFIFAAYMIGLEG